MADRVKRLTDKRLTTSMFRTSAPSTSGHGCDISSWKGIYGDRPPRKYFLFVGGDQAMNITSPSLWLYFPDRAAWSNVGALNGGSTIVVVGASQDYCEEVHNIGLATRMAVVGTPSVGTGSAACEPVEEEE